MYIGRFAPSPTGPIHFGTLVTAYASFLQARQNHGKWLVRIEDVDTQRTVPGAADAILKSLNNLGMYWDDSVIYQSQNFTKYQSILDLLKEQNKIYPCSCSRSDYTGNIYPGTCRKALSKNTTTYSLRIKTSDENICFTDQFSKITYCSNILKETGDFVLKNAQNLYTYHLAVVFDDAEQGITEIVRGMDLIESTSRQIYLQKQLGYSQPDYAHIPLVLDDSGKKLSKSTRNFEIKMNNPVELLAEVLLFLNQDIPQDFNKHTLNDAINFAVQLWDPTKIFS